MSERKNGDYRIFQSEVRDLVELTWNQTKGCWECKHMAPPISMYQTGHMALDNGFTKPFAMCPQCYQPLHDAGLAPQTPTWPQPKPSEKSNNGANTSSADRDWETA